MKPLIKRKSSAEKITFVGPIIFDMGQIEGSNIASYYLLKELMNQKKEVVFIDLKKDFLSSMKNLFSCNCIWFIYPRGRLTELVVLIVTYLLNKKLILYVNDLPIMQFRDLTLQKMPRITTFTLKLLETMLFLRAYVVISTSPYFFDIIKTNAKYRIVFPPGICDEDLNKDYCIDKKHGIDVLLYAGSLDRSGMITKLSTMFKELEGWQFWIAGSGTEKIDLNCNVKYLGVLSKTKLRDVYSQADAIIVPYPQLEYYNLIIPLKAAEILVTYKPIITSKLKGLEAYLRFLNINNNNNNIVYIKDLSKSELLAALNEAKYIKKAMPSDFHEKISAFSWEKRTKKLIKLLDNYDQSTETLIWV